MARAILTALSAGQQSILAGQERPEKVAEAMHGLRCGNGSVPREEAWALCAGLRQGTFRRRAFLTEGSLRRDYSVTAPRVSRDVFPIPGEGVGGAERAAVAAECVSGESGRACSVLFPRRVLCRGCRVTCRGIVGGRCPGNRRKRENLRPAGRALQGP